jgi:hypothetical protein
MAESIASSPFFWVSVVIVLMALLILIFVRRKERPIQSDDEIIAQIRQYVHEKVRLAKQLIHISKEKHDMMQAHDIALALVTGLVGKDIGKIWTDPVKNEIRAESAILADFIDKEKEFVVALIALKNLEVKIYKSIKDWEKFLKSQRVQKRDMEVLDQLRGIIAKKSDNVQLETGIVWLVQLCYNHSKNEIYFGLEEAEALKEDNFEVILKDRFETVKDDAEKLKANINEETGIVQQIVSARIMQQIRLLNRILALVGHAHEQASLEEAPSAPTTPPAATITPAPAVTTSSSSSLPTITAVPTTRAPRVPPLNQKPQSKALTKEQRIEKAMTTLTTRIADTAPKKKAEAPPDSAKYQQDILTMENDEFKRYIARMASDFGFTIYRDDSWIGFKKGEPPLNEPMGYKNSRSLWKLFINPKSAHFLDAFHRCLIALSKFDDVCFKLWAFNSGSRSFRRGQTVYENPNEPKLIIYFQGKDSKNKLVMATKEIVSQFSKDELAAFGCDRGQRDGYYQWGPSFTRGVNKLMFYNQGGFEESERAKFCTSQDRWENQKSLMRSSLFEGQNFHLYKGEIDPFQSDPWENTVIRELGKKDLTKLVLLGKQVRGTLRNLKWTHNTGWTIKFGNVEHDAGLKSILKTGILKAHGPRGVNFRYGIDAGYGSIIIIMKDSIESEGAFADFSRKGKVLFDMAINYGRDGVITDGNAVRELKERISVYTDFRKEYQKLNIHENSKGNYTTDDMNKMYMRSYYNPQLHVYKNISISMIDRILVPEHLYKDVMKYFESDKARLEASGITRSTFVLVKTGTEAQFKRHATKDELLFRWGHKRPEFGPIVQGGTNNAVMGVKGLYKMEQAYYLYLVDPLNKELTKAA